MRIVCIGSACVAKTRHLDKKDVMSTSTRILNKKMLWGPATEKCVCVMCVCVCVHLYV